jgi:multiple antibiotic resistance protein
MSSLAIWISTFGLVFAIIDPFGYVPVFLSMTAADTVERRRAMLKKACVAAFGVLAVFTLLGNHILLFFGISIPALQISGGLILLAIGFEMLKVSPVAEKLTLPEESEGRAKEDISIVPLAIPMLSGPASISTVVVLSSKAHRVVDYCVILISILVTLAFTYLILRSATRVMNLVGRTGLNILTRVMGLLLCAMAVQFVINGYQAIK